MKKTSVLVLAVMAAAFVSGCAQKTASEQLADDMKKMQNDMNRTAKKIQNDLK